MIQKSFDDLIHLPHFLDELPGSRRRILAVHQESRQSGGELQGLLLHRARVYQFPIALEGALKLKEIAYVHAEGYAGGELKHGPIAMIDKGMTVVVIAPHDSWHDKTVSNLEEVKARGATILGIGDSGDTKLRSLCDHWIPPLSTNSRRTIDESLLPFVTTPAVQLLSYEIAVLRGTDVDKPRNLAKSVTVE